MNGKSKIGYWKSLPRKTVLKFAFTLTLTIIIHPDKQFPILQ